MRKLSLLLLLLWLPFSAGSKNGSGFVVVTDYVKADAGRDVSDDIQQIIDSNPNRTIYFPDGVYLISKPILTPADPRKSVALELSNYAVIRASEDWTSEEAMIRLGGKDAANDIKTPGSNYYIDGGVIDGSGVARGISIDSGRETVIRNTSIKNVSVGIHIKHGANSGSSDSDIHDVNIVGNFRKGCIGVLVEGFDNTFTNMRIGGVWIGMKILSGGNSLRNIHPLFYNTPEGYDESCGFWCERNDNWFDFCYSDQFATGFHLGSGHVTLTNCFVYWYAAVGNRHTAIETAGPFNAQVTNLSVGFWKHNAVKENIVLRAGKDGGRGQIIGLSAGEESLLTDTSHEKYMR